jgi:hypothetical protein
MTNQHRLLPDEMTEPTEFFFVNLEDTTGAELQASQAPVNVWDYAALRNFLPVVGW